MKPILFCLAVLLCSLNSCKAQDNANLVPDASFEAPTPSWFSENGHGSYFAAKELAAGAADGRKVLAIQAWDAGGSTVLSPVFALAGDIYSATARVRSFGQVSGAQVELALYDEKGEKKVASFGVCAVDGAGQWKSISSGGVKLTAATANGRLAIVVSGPWHGARIEVDQVGLFTGGSLGPVGDNADFASFEAADMADGKAWKVRPPFDGRFGALHGNMNILDGAQDFPRGDNQPVSHTIEVRLAGPHRLWMHFVHLKPEQGGKFTVALQQEGKTVASHEVDDGDPRFGAAYQWVWDSLDAVLAAGPVQVMVTRPPGAASGSARKIDLFALTNLLSYQPEIQDFLPAGFVRFTNKSNEAQPFCLWTFVAHSQGPIIYVDPGVLSAAGFNGNVVVPADQSKWLAPGQSSPWVNLSRFLSPGVNRVQFVATRQMHTAGFVDGNWRGALEFATGPDHQVVRKVEIDQNGPRVLMTLPVDFKNESSDILTSSDYVAPVEAALDKIGAKVGQAAKYLDLSAILMLDARLDDPRLIDREINILKRMGFNGTYKPITDPKDAVDFAVQHGLAQHFGMWMNVRTMTGAGGVSDPDTAKMNAMFKSQATLFAPIVDKIERMALADEPRGMSYEQIVANDVCRAKFAAELKAAGYTAEQLGVASWADVVPVLPADRDKHPELFYQTGLFRLRSFADFWRTAVSIKQKYLPANIKTYVNYSPPHSNLLTWTQSANDPFMAQRDGGLELGWTEDWRAYGASLEQMSPLYAQLRAAGSPTNEPLGGFMVAVSGGPEMQRLKYYTMVAGGARHIDVYAYGPFYNGVDSWSINSGVYPVICAVQHELGVIDGALHGTTRRAAQIAILYNRTANIWALDTSATAQDSRYIQWALAHAGYDADFIPEEDIEAGKLNNYKVLYAGGVQLRREAAAKIADWVQAGGVLFGSAGAGSRDQYNKPMDNLERVFGAASKNLKLENDVGRPKYELRKMPVLDILTTVEGSRAPAVAFNQLGFREDLVPIAGAEIILKNKEGEAAGVLNHYGQGTAVRLAALPGVSYLNDAVRGDDYDIESYLPQNYRPELRDFIAWPALLAHVPQVAHTDERTCEITRYDAVDRAVVFVVDYSGKPVANFVMKLPDAAQFTHAYTATGKPVQLTRLTNGLLQLSWPLDLADAVVLERTTPTIPLAAVDK